MGSKSEEGWRGHHQSSRSHSSQWLLCCREEHRKILSESSCVRRGFQGIWVSSFTRLQNTQRRKKNIPSDFQQSSTELEQGISSFCLADKLSHWAFCYFPCPDEGLVHILPLGRHTSNPYESLLSPCALHRIASGVRDLQGQRTALTEGVLSGFPAQDAITGTRHVSDPSCAAISTCQEH